jgi:predicted transcriptional regulator
MSWCMRTTVRLDEALLTEAKKLAVDTNRSLTAIIEDALREVVRRRKVTATQKGKITFPVFKG